VFVVDTNILLYAADRDSPGHRVCRGLLLEWRAQTSPWFMTWGIIYEFIRVATHPNVFRNPFTLVEAWRFLSSVLASPTLGILTETPRHGELLARMIRAQPAVRGNLVFEAHTAILMHEHGLRTIYTHDADFNRFPEIEVIDPL
jgi:toxin-antitoxin system PIN domain toxin